MTRTPSTRRGLHAEQPLLVGRLRIHQSRDLRERPYLTLAVHCPYCRDRPHFHGWPRVPPFRADTVEHRAAHCRSGPLHGQGYLVGLNPDLASYHRRLLVDFLRELDDWKRRCPDLAVTEADPVTGSPGDPDSTLVFAG